MCTASWYFLEDGSYSLFFNRDESRERSAAMEPKIFSEESVTYQCPIDREGGGTWILSNEFGLSMCLLNHYDHASDEQHLPTTSRGQLLLTLAKSRSVGEFTKAVKRESLTQYRAFTLLALDLSKQVVVMHWDTEEMHELPNVCPPLISSSYEAEKVYNYRVSLFNMVVKKQELSSQVLENYHHMHDPQYPAYSPWMVRDDASTVSYTQVDVRQGVSEMTYVPASREALKFLAPTQSQLDLSDA